ncbi:MAG TPA: Bax inhibitor-1/YccA family protein [Micropepsaceae bacterium]|nr:Bax inhibitor-1/YccA family protein [Micropepsaceae bacterium]
MAEYDNRVRSYGATSDVAIDAGLRAYMLRVYNYMLMGLGLTGLTAWFTASTPAFAQLFFTQAAGGYSLSGLGWIVLLAPLALVFFISFRIQQMSFATAQATFWVYAGLMGIGLTPILLLYTGASVAQVFFTTAATFGAMSLWGYTTKRDLSGFGSFLFMGLIGILIASVVNMFLQSGMMQWIISVLGVLIFTGLTAYDTQSIKETYFVGDDGTVTGKKAIMGALRLYLDFINLFLMLLRLMGDRR